MSEYFWHRHRNDRGFDEVRLVTDPLILRARCFLRYKTSHLSGDEWRFSVGWESSADGGATWEPYDTGYLDLGSACAAAYPGLYSSHPKWHQLSCALVEWWRKGKKLYEQTYDGAARPLLTVAGHLPWGHIVAGEGLPRWPSMEFECFQVGCTEIPVSTYVMKLIYCPEGHEGKAVFGFGDNAKPYARRFCRVHLRRGDCGLDDADDNYEVVSGPGPGEHETPAEQIKESGQIVL